MSTSFRLKEQARLITIELADCGHLNHLNNTGLLVFYGEGLLVASRPREEFLGFPVNP